MKKSYTKHQIVEAIKHWEYVLKRMDESKSPLLDVFAKTFEEDVIFSIKPNISITLENVKTIYDILNKNVFNNALNIKSGSLDLYCDTCTNINSILHNQYGAPSGYDISNMFALFHPKLRWMKSLTTGKSYLISLRNGIFINLDYGKKAVLPYLISTICHEMIHCYDCIKGQLLQMTVYCLSIGCDASEISYESHFTPVFKEKSTEMKNKHGITINVTADDKSFDELNDLAASEIQILREDEVTSDLVPIDFSKKFKEKYSKLMTFCNDGTVLMRFS